MKLELLLNSVSTLVLHGLTTGKDGSAIPLVLKRSTVPPLKITYLDNPEDVEPEDVPPPRLPSHLPPPGKHSLVLNVDEPISQGRVGMVHSVLVDTSTSSAANSFHIPPLVVKVCVPGQTSDILNEAASYDEMEVLQGVCIPRCYGLFQTSYVSDELDFPIMAERKARDEKLRCEAEEDLEDETLDPVVYDDLVTVLLMERVGDRLKLGSPLPHGVREDMTDMYNDIGRLFLCHHDIRYSNFLSALPEDQGGLPSLPSPFTGRTYSWRVMDFDLMKKTPLPKVAFRAYHFSYIYRVLHNVPYGYIVEPWE